MFDRVVVVFLVLAFGLSWTVSEVYYRVLGPSQLGAGLMPIAYMAGPALAALVAVRAFRPAPALGPVFRWNWWLVLGPAGTVVFSLATVLACTALPGVDLNFSADALSATILAQVPQAQQALAREQLDAFGAALPLLLAMQILLGGLLAGLTINALVAFGEELGWRGLLHNAWSHLGFWRPALACGALWGLWHAPLILRGHNYPEHPEVGVGMMIAFCMLLSPLMSEVRARGGSVWAAATTHGTMNAVGGAVVFLDGGNDLLVGMTGAVGLAVLLAANLVLLSVRRNAARVAVAT